MNRTEAAAKASQAAAQAARQRRLAAAAQLLRDAGWTVVEPSATHEPTTES